MIKKYFNFFVLSIIFCFIFMTTKYYFSEKNIIYTNKSRSSYSLFLANKVNNLKVLTNDTQDIIEYVKQINKTKKKKFNFWKLLEND